MPTSTLDGYGDLDLTLSPSTTLYSPSSPFEKHPFPRLEIETLDTSPFSGLFSSLIKDGLPPVKEPANPTVSTEVSYDVERFTDLKGLQSGWYDEDVDEIVVLSPKKHLRHPGHQRMAAEVCTKTTLAPEFDSINSLPLAPATPTSTTRLCRKRDTGRIYVMKTFLNATIQPPLEYKILQIVSDLKLPFVPQIHWSFPGLKDLCIITDYYPRKNIERLVMNGGPLKPGVALFYASEIIQGLYFLHRARIVHRDLCPGNIMIDTDGHVVLTGFRNADHLSGCDKRGVFVTRIAVDPKSVSFYAPELVLGWAHDYSVDCWGFGVLLYYMLAGERLFVGGEETCVTETTHNIVHGRVVLCPALGSESRDLISKCLERSSVARLTLGRIRAHPYFASVSWEEVFQKSIPVPYPVDPSFDTDHGITLLDVQPKSYSVPSPNPAAGPECAILGGNKLGAQEVASTNVPLEPPKRMRRNAQSLPKILRMSSLLDDVPEEVIEDTKSAKSYPPRHEDTSENSSGIYGDHGGTTMQSEGPISREERMAKFWAMLDSEQEAKHSSKKVWPVGGRGSLVKSRKLRKARSATSASPTRRFSTLSATSLQGKMWRKTRPSPVSSRRRQDAASLCGPPAPPPSPVPLVQLPVGIEHIGSGIGFKYNLAADQARSKASVCTSGNAPLICHGMFQGLGLAGLGLRIGNGFGTTREKVKGRLRSLTPASACDTAHSGSGTRSGSEAATACRPSGDLESESVREDDVGESSWSMMAVPSGTVMVIGDAAVSVMGSPEVGSAGCAQEASGLGVDAQKVDDNDDGGGGELQPGVVGRSKSAQSLRGLAGDNGEVVTLRLVPSRPTVSTADLLEGDGDSSVSSSG